MMTFQLLKFQLSVWGKYVREHRKTRYFDVKKVQLVINRISQSTFICLIELKKRKVHNRFVSTLYHINQKEWSWKTVFVWQMKEWVKGNHESGFYSDVPLRRFSVSSRCTVEFCSTCLRSIVIETKKLEKNVFCLFSTVSNLYFSANFSLCCFLGWNTYYFVYDLIAHSLAKQ